MACPEGIELSDGLFLGFLGSSTEVTCFCVPLDSSDSSPDFSPAVTALPASTVSAARSLFAAGYRAIDPMPRVAPPLGAQPIAAQYVSEYCWQAVVLLDLQHYTSSPWDRTTR